MTAPSFCRLLTNRTPVLNRPTAQPTQQPSKTFSSDTTTHLHRLISLHRSPPKPRLNRHRILLKTLETEPKKPGHHQTKNTNPFSHTRDPTVYTPENPKTLPVINTQKFNQKQTPAVLPKRRTLTHCKKPKTTTLLTLRQRDPKQNPYIPIQPLTYKQSSERNPAPEYKNYKTKEKREKLSKNRKFETQIYDLRFRFEERGSQIYNKEIIGFLKV